MASPPQPSVSSAGDPEAEKKHELEKKDLCQWLDAWYDPVANVKTHSACIALSDLNADGDYRLIIADNDRKLRIWKGTQLVSEHALLEAPVALVSYYMDESRPQTPAIAVASGPHIYIYRNLRPYYKFTLPPQPIDPQESEVWKLLKNGLEPQKAIEMLATAKERGVQLTTRSLDLIAMEDQKQIVSFIEANIHLPLYQQTVITCLASIRKSRDERGAIGCLIVGTEKNQVLILEPVATEIQKKVTLKSTPVFLVSTGLLDVEHRIIAACRNGKIYAIKNGEVTNVVIDLEVQPVGLVRLDKNIVVGCMNNTIHAFNIKGTKTYSIYLPAAITNMERLIQDTTTAKALIVALDNGEIRVYIESNLISVIQTHEIVTGIRYGRFGRESGSLILTFKSGALAVKILSRNSNLSLAQQAVQGPPPEQDIPLNIPKKTKLYLEYVKREEANAAEIHRVFQRDLYKLRLTTMRAYVKVLTDTQGPISYTAGTALRLTAQVQGIGPLFKLKLQLENTGNRVLHNIPVTFAYNHYLYRMKSSLFIVPLLIPGTIYKYEAEVVCIDENGGADTIRVFLCNPISCLPVITANVTMPISEMFFDQL